MVIIYTIDNMRIVGQVMGYNEVDGKVEGINLKFNNTGETWEIKMSEISSVLADSVQ
jgi:hypothetical protein